MSSLSNIWSNIKEVDLRPLRQEAEEIVKIALVGASGSGVSELAERMRRDPRQEQSVTQTPLLVLDLDEAQKAEGADLILLLVNATAKRFEREQQLARSWSDVGHKVLVLIHSPSASETSMTVQPWANWGQKKVLYGSIADEDFLLNTFAPAIIDLLPTRLISLGRHFPLFRVPIAHHIISETSFSNAAYSLSTGLAEIVPVFDIPLNVADMVVLSKAQAFLIYRLGLALGLSTNWQDYVAEFGSVLGGGFLWRQLARSLVGLIPLWGIVPKVSVAYAGTFVVGHAVLHWYLTGRHVSKDQMRQLYSQAFSRGKQVARSLADKMPRPRLRRRKSAELPPPSTEQICAQCGRASAADATFCQYCGHPLSPDETPA